MLRGINQVQLFYDESDKQAFLARLQRYRSENLYQIYAYALMGNHTHLLVKENIDTISTSMKKLALSYCYYFNIKYDRSGCLFAERFRSEPIENDSYLLAALRYIHNNPVKIGKTIDSWTSYNDYLVDSDCIDSDFVLSIFADDKPQARRQFQDFMNAEEEQSISESSTILATRTERRLTDEQAIKIIKEVANIGTCGKLTEFDKESRERVLFQLKAKDLSIRQISRLTGISRGIVQRAEKTIA